MRNADLQFAILAIRISQFLKLMQPLDHLID